MVGLWPTCRWNGARYDLHARAATVEPAEREDEEPVVKLVETSVYLGS